MSSTQVQRRSKLYIKFGDLSSIVSRVMTQKDWQSKDRNKLLTAAIGPHAARVGLHKNKPGEQRSQTPSAT